MILLAHCTILLLGWALCQDIICSNNCFECYSGDFSGIPSAVPVVSGCSRCELLQTTFVVPDSNDRVDTSFYCLQSFAENPCASNVTLTSDSYENENGSVVKTSSVKTTCCSSRCNAISSNSSSRSSAIDCFIGSSTSLTTSRLTTLRGCKQCTKTFSGTGSEILGQTYQCVPDDGRASCETQASEVPAPAGNGTVTTKVCSCCSSLCNSENFDCSVTKSLAHKFEYHTILLIAISLTFGVWQLKI